MVGCLPGHECVLLSRSAIVQVVVPASTQHREQADFVTRIHRAPAFGSPSLSRLSLTTTRSKGIIAYEYGNDAPAPLRPVGSVSPTGLQVHNR